MTDQAGFVGTTAALIRGGVARARRNGFERSGEFGAPFAVSKSIAG